MAFAGFVSSGLVPAAAGALKGRNMGRQQAEEQRRYETEQAQLASQTKWRQQQALEQAQRQAMMDALAQQAQEIGAKGGVESREIQRQGMEQQAAQADLNRRNAIEIARLGAQSRESVAGINARGKLDAKMAGGTAGGGAGGASPGQETDLAELDASLVDIANARREVGKNTSAFSIGKQVASNIPLLSGLGRNLVDRADPGGISARSAVGVITSTIRRIQSGTAVTKNEKEVLENFLPDPRADSDEVILQKLDNLEQWINAKRASLETRSGAGAMPSGSPATPTAPGLNARDRAAQLKEQGYGREEAMTILRQEGYRVE